MTPAGTVKLSWEDAQKFRPFMVQYTILYHRDGDGYNKVKQWLEEKYVVSLLFGALIPETQKQFSIIET